MSEKPEEIGNQLSAMVTRLTKIEGDIEHLKDIQRFAVAANPMGRDYVAQVFKEREGSARLYLAIGGDDPQTQDALMDAVGMGHTNVSDLCRYLEQVGFVRRVPSQVPGSRYQYTWGELERVLGISKVARKIVGN